MGASVDILWIAFCKNATGVYELLPGFVAGLLAGIVVACLTKAPSQEVNDLYDKAVSQE